MGTSFSNPSTNSWSDYYYVLDIMLMSSSLNMLNIVSQIINQCITGIRILNPFLSNEFSLIKIIVFG